MTDIIWGNVGKIISNNIFELNVTHRKDGNKNSYSDIEKIKFTGTDIVTIPADPLQCTKEVLEQNLGDMFVKLEIDQRDGEGNVVGFVSHSGQGGH